MGKLCSNVVEDRSIHNVAILSTDGATEIAGVDKSARSKLQGVEIAGVDNLARDDRGGQGGSGQRGTK